MQRPPVAVCFLLLELALLPAPALGTPGASLPPLVGGLWEVPGDTGMATSPLRHTPAASFPVDRTVLTS